MSKELFKKPKEEIRRVPVKTAIEKGGVKKTIKVRQEAISGPDEEKIPKEFINKTGKEAAKAGEKIRKTIAQLDPAKFEFLENMNHYLEQQFDIRQKELERRSKPEATNLDLWNQVEVTDPVYVQKVQYGAKKYHTIDAMSRRKKATEVFGMYGKEWGLKDLNFVYLKDKEEIVLVILNATFFVYNCTLNTSFPISTDINFREGKDQKVVEDIHKKLITDATTKALSFLGFNADVYMGKFDDDKYQSYAQQHIEEADPEKQKTIEKIWDKLNELTIPDKVAKRIAALTNVGTHEELKKNLKYLEDIAVSDVKVEQPKEGKEKS